MHIGIKIGDREVFLLGMLCEDKLYGYQIHQLIEHHAGFFLEVDRSAIYNSLSKMERHELVSVEQVKVGKAPDRKLYEISEKGREILTDSLLNEDNTGRLNIIGSLNLLTNIHRLPERRLRKYLMRRIELLNETEQTLTDDRTHADALSLSTYLRNQVETEKNIAGEMLKSLEDSDGNRKHD